MKKLDLQQFTDLMDAAHIKPKLKSELRFITSTSHMRDEDWADTELLQITDRSGNKGVLIITNDTDTYVLPCEFHKVVASATTGRAQPIICDFCATWQSGSRAGSVVFIKVKKGTANISHLCCADLACSQHVRTKTSAARISRAQIHEDMSTEQRIARLNLRVRTILKVLQAEPVAL